MSSTAREILSSFFDGAGSTATSGRVSIDVLDSWTNSGLAAVAPTTISWCDGRSPGGDATTAA